MVIRSCLSCSFLVPYFPAPTQIYTLSLHDALPISARAASSSARCPEDGRAADQQEPAAVQGGSRQLEDRKSTRLNSSHRCISYAVFCLKKKSTRNRFIGSLHGDLEPAQRRIGCWR